MKKLLLLVTFFTLSICGVMAQNDTMYVMKDGNIIYSIPVKPSDVDSIVFYRLPTIKVTGVNTICEGESTTLTANGGSTYTWSPSTGLSSTTGTSVTAIPTSTTTYTVTGTDQYGYKNTQTITVIVNSLSTIEVAGVNTICEGSSTTLTASGGSSYTWSPSTDLSITTGTSITANPTSTTTYTVEGTDVNGCSNTTDVTVTVNPLPIISITGTSDITEGESTVLTASGGVTYTWNPSTNLSGTIGVNVTASPIDTITYTVTGTDSNGCSNTTSITVNVTKLPTDIDGNKYKIVRIGKQTWMAENLKVTKYNDGTEISLVTDGLAWQNLTTPSYCFYDNNVDNKDIYGALYNWYAVNTGKLCPLGWRVASNEDWDSLKNYVGVGSAAKLRNSTGWIQGNGTNDYGFSALPAGGRRVPASEGFQKSGTSGDWWSSTSENNTKSWTRTLYFGYSEITQFSYLKGGGLSVRCVQD